MRNSVWRVEESPRHVVEMIAGNNNDQDQQVSPHDLQLPLWRFPIAAVCHLTGTVVTNPDNGDTELGFWSEV